MRQHKGFSILELVVVIAISSLLLTVTGLGFNALSNEAAKQQIADSQRTIGLIIAQLVSTGTTINTGYYTPADFQAAYGVALPGNPLNSSDPTQGQWYIQNESGTYTGTYNVYAAKDGSYIASTKYVVNNEFPYINNISKRVTVPTTTEYSSSAPIREKNLLYDGSFEKGGVGWDGIGITNKFTYNQSSVEEDTTGFFTSDWNVEPGAQIERVSTEKWEGNYSLRVTTNGAAAYQGVSILATGNLPRGNYTFTIHVKAPAGTPMRLVVHDGATPGNVYPIPCGIGWTANGDWQEKSLSFYSAYDTAVLQCQVTLNNSTVATVFYLDGNRLDYHGKAHAKLSADAYKGDKSLMVEAAAAAAGGGGIIEITNMFTYNQSSVEEDTTGFFTSDHNVEPGAQIERVSTEKWEGNYSLRVTTNGAAAYQGVSIRATGNLPRGNYTFTIHVKAPAGTPMRLVVRDGATPGNVYPIPCSDIWTANGDWQEKSLSFYSVYDTTLLQCQVTLNDSTVATVFYLDGNRLDYHGNNIGDEFDSFTLKQELSVSNLPLDRYYAVMHFKNVSADPAKTSVAFDFYYKTPTATVFSYTWNPTLSNYTWQENTFISNVVGSKTGTVGIAVTVKGTTATAAGYVLIDDLGLYLLPGGE